MTNQTLAATRTFAAILAGERLKTRRAWGLYAVVALLIGLNLANGVANYFQNIATFHEQGVTWMAVWGQSGLLYTLLFFPIVISIKVASLTRIEHDNSNWQRMASYGAVIQVTYRGKILSLAAFVSICQLMYFVAFLTMGLASGFALSVHVLAEFALLIFSGWIGAMTIGCLQLFIGLIVKSFASTVAIGFIGTITGFALTLAVPALQALYPYTQIGVGMHVRTLIGPSLEEFMPFLVSNAVLTGLFFWAGRIYLKKREY